MSALAEAQRRMRDQNVTCRNLLQNSTNLTCGFVLPKTYCDLFGYIHEACCMNDFKDLTPMTIES